MTAHSTAHIASRITAPIASPMAIFSMWESSRLIFSSASGRAFSSWEPTYRLPSRAHGKSSDEKRHALTKSSVGAMSAMFARSYGRSRQRPTSGQSLEAASATARGSCQASLMHRDCSSPRSSLNLQNGIDACGAHNAKPTSRPTISCRSTSAAGQSPSATSAPARTLRLISEAMKPTPTRFGAAALTNRFQSSRGGVEGHASGTAPTGNLVAVTNAAKHGQSALVFGASQRRKLVPIRTSCTWCGTAVEAGIKPGPRETFHSSAAGRCPRLIRSGESQC